MKLIDADMIMREFGLGDDCDTCIQNKRDCRYIPIYSKMDLCDFVDRAAHDVDLWIPCSERLPDSFNSVLVSLGGMVSVAWYDGGGWVCGTGFGTPLSVNPDAWMPLPEPYKEEKGE